MSTRCELVLAFSPAYTAEVTPHTGPSTAFWEKIRPSTHQLAHRDSELASIVPFRDAETHGPLLHDLELLELRVDLSEKANLFLFPAPIKNVLCSLAFVFKIEFVVLDLIFVVKARCRRRRSRVRREGQGRGGGRERERERGSEHIGR